MKIKAKYEVLYNDLVSHSIDSFLISRVFKVYMTKNGYFDTWQEIKDEIKSKRNYYFPEINYELLDESETLIAHLNGIENARVEHLVSSIITEFIMSKNDKADVSDILESVKIVGFSDANISSIEKAIEIYNKKEFAPKENKEEQNLQKKKTDIKNTSEIFIVHGHNEEIKHNVARVLEKLKLKPIILHEQSNEGLTIIEKFEKHSNVSFAIALLTYDDDGNAKSINEKNKRARQNVILELGYFAGKLGRSRIFSLYEEGVELPSDLAGILYTKLDAHEAWKQELVKELKSAGFNVDANDLFH